MDMPSRPAKAAIISATDRWDEVILDLITDHRFGESALQTVREKPHAEAPNLRYDPDIEILFRILAK